MFLKACMLVQVYVRNADLAVEGLAVAVMISYCAMLVCYAMSDFRHDDMQCAAVELIGLMLCLCKSRCMNGLSNTYQAPATLLC
jgi:hypothetical protein